MKKQIALLILCAVILSLFTGCGRKPAEENEDVTPKETVGTEEAVKPTLPDDLTRNAEDVPVILVYDVKNESYDELNIEDYVMGVLAGEMRNDWPMEALKAQAILARTFVLKFISEKESKYEGADISTDIAEAQAYDPDAINERIRKAVNETGGQVLSYNGELPYAWFHAHAGGQTELPVEGLAYDKDNPPYIKSVKSPDSDKAPTSVKNWTAEFSADAVAQAAADCGVDVGETVSSIELGRKSASGRTVEFLINGQSVSAPDLRVNLDSTRLKSTLISSVTLKDGKIIFTGSGYGHGVGMSQWGAYAMAESGQKAEEIINHYFNQVGIAKVW